MGDGVAKVSRDPLLECLYRRPIGRVVSRQVERLARFHALTPRRLVRAVALDHGQCRLLPLPGGPMSARSQRVCGPRARLALTVRSSTTAFSDTRCAFVKAGTAFHDPPLPPSVGYRYSLDPLSHISKPRHPSCERSSQMPALAPRGAVLSACLPAAERVARRRAPRRLAPPRSPGPEPAPPAACARHRGAGASVCRGS